MHPLVSIFICTRNRAEDLRKTLQTIGRASVPADLPAEIVVIDNGSTDSTSEVIRTANLPNLPMIHRFEPQPGKSRALNQAMAVSRSTIFLHTDDDVRVPPDWIEGMCRPVANGDAQAIAGSIKMAPHLRRPWMERIHKNWLLEYDFSDTETSGVMIGANMAFSRKVFDIIGGFDEELGPGALGYSDDVLLSWQVQKAGFSIRTSKSAPLIHHFNPLRLTRESLVNRAQCEGRVSAFLFYHWLHSGISALKLRRLCHQAYLGLRRRWESSRDQFDQGAPTWELTTIRDITFAEQMSRERRRPRKYDRYGQKVRA